MRRAAAFLLPLLAGGTAAAQFDTIHLTDGTKVDRCRIRDYSCKEIRYTQGRLEQTAPREKVFAIELGQARVNKTFGPARKAAADEDFSTAYQRWLKAAEDIQKHKAFATFAQFAYWEAFQLALKVGTAGDRKECLDALAKTEGGATGFWPQIWRYRLEVARNEAGSDRKRLEAYKALVASFRDFVTEHDLSERYEIEAELYAIDARGLLREIKAQQLEEALQHLLPRVEGSYPDLANRVNLEFAYAVLATKRNEDARKLFTAIARSKVADDVTKAKALIGRGHTWLRVSPQTPENAKRALLDYMRVAVNHEDAGVEIVGEALYHAAQAYRLWNGPDVKANVRRIRSRLKLKYRDSSWAKK